MAILNTIATNLGGSEAQADLLGPKVDSHPAHVLYSSEVPVELPVLSIMNSLS